MTSAQGSDILAAYRFLLGREPEATLDLATSAKAFPDWPAVRDYFLNSPEASVALLSEIRALPQIWSKFPTKFNRQIYLCLSDIGVAREILLSGDHEPQVGEAILDLLPDDGVFLDVGANVGWFTLMGGDKLARAGRGGRVIAVEGNPVVVPYLCTSVVESGLAGHVEIKPYAVSNATGFVGFDCSTQGNLGGQRAQSTDAIAAGQRQIVPALRLDDILADLGRLDLIKIDIEGSEPFALQGARAVLDRFKPPIIAEINAKALSSVAAMSAQGFVELMRDLGYQPFALQERQGPPLDDAGLCRIVAERGYCDFLFLPIG